MGCVYSSPVDENSPKRRGPVDWKEVDAAKYEGQNQIGTSSDSSNLGPMVRAASTDSSDSSHLSSTIRMPSTDSSGSHSDWGSSSEKDQSPRGNSATSKDKAWTDSLSEKECEKMEETRGSNGDGNFLKVATAMREGGAESGDQTTPGSGNLFANISPKLRKLASLEGLQLSPKLRKLASMNSLQSPRAKTLGKWFPSGEQDNAPTVDKFMKLHRRKSISDAFLRLKEGTESSPARSLSRRRSIGEVPDRRNEEAELDSWQVFDRSTSFGDAAFKAREDAGMLVLRGTRSVGDAFVRVRSGGKREIWAVKLVHIGVADAAEEIAVMEEEEVRQPRIANTPRKRRTRKGTTGSIAVEAIDVNKLMEGLDDPEDGDEESGQAIDSAEGREDGGARPDPWIGECQIDERRKEGTDEVQETPGAEVPSGAESSGRIGGEVSKEGGGEEWRAEDREDGGLRRGAEEETKKSSGEKTLDASGVPFVSGKDNIAVDERAKKWEGVVATLDTEESRIQSSLHPVEVEKQVASMEEDSGKRIFQEASGKDRGMGKYRVMSKGPEPGMDEENRVSHPWKKYQKINNLRVQIVDPASSDDTASNDTEEIGSEDGDSVSGENDVKAVDEKGRMLVSAQELRFAEKWAKGALWEAVLRAQDAACAGGWDDNSEEEVRGKMLTPGVDALSGLDETALPDVSPIMTDAPGLAAASVTNAADNATSVSSELPPTEKRSPPRMSKRPPRSPRVQGVKKGAVPSGTMAMGRRIVSPGQARPIFDPDLLQIYEAAFEEYSPEEWKRVPQTLPRRRSLDVWVKAVAKARGRKMEAVMDDTGDQQRTGGQGGSTSTSGLLPPGSTDGGIALSSSNAEAAGVDGLRLETAGGEKEIGKKKVVEAVSKGEEDGSEA